MKYAILIVMMMMASVVMGAEKIIQVPDMFTATPKEIRGGSNNEAAADRFSQEKWNKWLADNIVGKMANTGATYASGVYKNANDDFCMRLTIGCKSVGESTPSNRSNDLHGITVICVFDKKLQSMLAKIGEGATVQVTGKIDSLKRFTYSDGSRERAGHDAVMVDCTVRIIKPASKK